ncbi:unnamed protein product, partial [Amoebophrya sp. A25]|eukprot:GSA25T00015640001.1
MLSSKKATFFVTTNYPKPLHQGGGSTTQFFLLINRKVKFTTNFCGSHK